MSEKIPLYTETSYDWYNRNQSANKPYAVNANVGINEYTFGRTTPNNKFIVASGLVLNKKGIEMVGGNKKIKLNLNKKKKGKNISKSIMSAKNKSLKGGHGLEGAPIESLNGKMDTKGLNFDYGVPEGVQSQMNSSTGGALKKKNNKKKSLKGG